ncbi:MAG TPA: dienelactone hydrolase family protein [Roseiflexaceae bacterium]|nr:dienelactone hydrolase family protein [Roseiflexaceae bacterium]
MNSTSTHTDVERPVRVDVGAAQLDALLYTPPNAHGVVVFAHASATGRHHPRCRFVASEIQRGGFAMLQIDLLTPEEEHVDQVTAQLRLNTKLLAARLAAATDWLEHLPETAALRPGYLGASTGGAALAAAALRPEQVGAVVLCGGYMDLGGPVIAQVCAPTLVVLGEHDTLAAASSRRALAALKVEKRLAMVPGATSLFDEIGSLGKLARLAMFWFQRHLAPAERAVGA